MKTCPDCARELIPAREWLAMDQAERRAIRGQKVRAAARGLCGPCYSHRQYHGTLHDLPLTNVPREDVLADWEWLAVPGKSRKANIAAIAPRLGMTTGALERALDRARGQTERKEVA